MKYPTLPEASETLLGASGTCRHCHLAMYLILRRTNALLQAAVTNSYLQKMVAYEPATSLQHGYPTVR